MISIKTLRKRALTEILQLPEDVDLREVSMRDLLDAMLILLLQAAQ